MAKRIVFSANALQDRLEILEFWNKRIGSKTYSRKLDQTFREIIKLLAEYPELGRQLPQKAERFFVKDAYQIFYQFDENTLMILHIWDSRRNPKDAPFQD